MVATGRFANESDLRHVRAGATIGAAGGANDDFLATKTEGGAKLFDPINEGGKHAFGLGETQSAGRQRWASHCGGMHDGSLIIHFHAVRSKQGGDARAVGIGNIGDDDVLIRREAELDLRILFGYRAERQLLGVSLDVLDAAGFDEDGEKKFSVHAAVPAVKITGGGEFVGPRICDGQSGTLIDLIPNPRDPAFLDDILEPRMLAVGAVAEITMDGQHRLPDGDHLVRSDESEHVRQTGEGFHVVVTATHAAADHHIVAEQLIALGNGNEAEIIGEDIHVVHGRNHETGLELAREVGLAVKRIDEILVRRVFEVELLPINPDGVIGPGLRGQGVGQFDAVLINQLASPGDGGGGGSSDVATDIAASGESGEQRFIDFFNERPETG